VLDHNFASVCLNDVREGAVAHQQQRLLIVPINNIKNGSSELIAILQDVPIRVKFGGKNTLFVWIANLKGDTDDFDAGT
jgi:hypothetical protein